MSKFQLTIYQDEDSQHLDPFDEDVSLFRLHSFNSQDTHFIHPDDLDEDLEGYWLSHYEHGLRHWSIQGTVQYPDMRWDGVEVAGFLEVVVSDEEREWWDEQSDEDKLESAKTAIASYTSWLNGEVYGYLFENVREEGCDKGFTHIYMGEDVDDSCFGIIGWEWLQEEVRMTTKYHDATADNTQVVDKAYGLTDYGTFFEMEDTNA